MADYPRFEYSMKDVKRAGELIAGEMPWTDETAPKIRDAFQIANNWRGSHAYPMRSVRSQLIWYMRKLGMDGVTGARLKRMPAIRRKLRRDDLPQNLSQLQDLAGVRAVLPTIADVRKLVGELGDHSRHKFQRQDDYIGRPKVDGYRSHHLIYQFHGRGSSIIHDGRRIEVQLRTRLQHSWATAVEAVGLFRNENLKGNQGSTDWLRLFKLMSGEFAQAEECSEPPDIPHHHLRASELKALEKKLEAVKILENLSHAVRFTDEAVEPREAPTYYLIRYNNASNEVHVDPYFAPVSAVMNYDNAESIDNHTGKNTHNSVLVEADKLESLKDAYPNYFGDVQLFKLQLKNITKGEGAREYVVRPQETVRPRPKENPNLTWLKRRIRWR